MGLTATRLSPPAARGALGEEGYAYLHSAVDGFSRLSCTEPLADETGTVAAAFPYPN